MRRIIADMTKETHILVAKQLRKDLDSSLQTIKEAVKPNFIATASSEFLDKNESVAQLTLAQRDLESCIMRLGMVLKNIGTPNPYPESYNPASSVVAPTADGLKL